MERLKSKKVFQQTFANGSRYFSKDVRINILTQEKGQKVAFVAAKRYGNAVFRNRSKRVLREAYKLVEPAILDSEGFSAILFANQNTSKLHPVDIAGQLALLFKQAGLIKSNSGDK